MSVPSHPFELLLYGRDGRIQLREYQSIAAAIEAVKSLRPTFCTGYRLSVVLDARNLKENPPC
jgi:hypothetical protein